MVASADGTREDVMKTGVVGADVSLMLLLTTLAYPSKLLIFGASGAQVCLITEMVAMFPEKETPWSCGI